MAQRQVGLLGALKLKSPLPFGSAQETEPLNRDIRIDDDCRAPPSKEERLARFTGV